MANLFLISGTDQFLIRQKATALLERLAGSVPEENPNLEIIHGDSQDLKPPELIRSVVVSINTPAFFGDSKIIWLKRLDFSAASKTKGGKEAIDELLKTLKGGLPDDITLVLDGIGLDRRSALYKTCQKAGEVHFFVKTDVQERKWAENIRVIVHNTCSEMGLTIAPDAAAFLAETSGTDTGRAVSEVHKLAAFIHPRTAITLEDCRAICSITPETAGWTFAEALVNKNLSGALDALNTLFNNKSYGVQVLYTVINRFQDMINIKTAAEKLGIPPNISVDGLKSRLMNVHPRQKEDLKGHMILKAHPFRVWNLYKQANTFTDKQLAGILTEILTVNRQLVSGICDSRLALELLAVKICV